MIQRSAVLAAYLVLLILGPAESMGNGSRWVFPGSRLFLEFPVALAVKGMTRDSTPTRQSGSPPV
jgi:hypothetical protein